MSKGFRVFLVASAAFLWLLVQSERGASMASLALLTMGLSVCLGVLAFTVVAYLGILAHELGHAVAAVALTPGRPLIEIGQAPRQVRLSIGRIDAHLGFRPGQARCSCSSPARSSAEEVTILAAGPFASAVVAGLWFWASPRVGSDFERLTFLLGVIEAAQAVQNLVPRQLKGRDEEGRPRYSDGAQIRAALLNRPLP